VVVLALVATGRSSHLAVAGAAQSAAPVGGAANILSTPPGVVWSFNIENGSGVVLRSTDDGDHWRVVLSEPASQSCFGLVASYFLGPDDAWAALEESSGTTSVYRTSDGGRHWYLSQVLVVAPPPSMPVLFDQLYFADPEHGWLLAVGTDLGVPGPTTSLTMLWWRTDNGGRSWSQLPPTSLPPQAVALPADAGSACPVFSPPHFAFATANIGWWTYGACGDGIARPLVWHTRDGGLDWTPTPLPAPPGGWGHWDVLDQGGTDVGTPYVIASGTRTVVVVPVSVGTSRLVIERSLDMGRSWHLAGVVGTHALPIQSTPADWFDPVNAVDWVVAAPGGLIETTNAGKSWTLTRSAIAVSGQPASFTSPAEGFVQGAGLVIAMRTGDGGRTWSPESASISRLLQASWSQGNAVSTIQLVSPHLAVAAGAAGLRTSSDGGRSWVDRLGTNFAQADLDFINSQVGFAVENGELVRTLDGGASWQALLHPVAGGVSGIEFWAPSAGLVSVGQSLFITSDAGTSWQPLRLPSGWIVSDTYIGGDEPTGVCFTDKGVGWAVASHARRFAVFVSTSAGRSWRIALSSEVLPPGAERDKLGGGVSIAACDGKAAWVLVSQAAGPMDMQGVPTTFDLLRSLDLGRSWLDVLRSASYIRVTRPKVPTSPGGPESVPLEFGGWVLSLASSTTTAWFTATNEDFGSVTFGSTRDGGVHWKIHSFPAVQSKQGTVAASQQLPYAYRWLATAALNASDAWALFSAPKGSGDSYLYATSDAGAAWHRLAVFG
jgi:hypothetical protein